MRGVNVEAVRSVVGRDDFIESTVSRKRLHVPEVAEDDKDLEY